MRKLLFFSRLFVIIILVIQLHLFFEKTLQHSKNYVVFLYPLDLLLDHQTQLLDLLAVFRAGGHDIDAGGVNAAVA